MNGISYLNKYFRISDKKNITRSYGLLEYFLAIQRAKIANKFIARKRKYGSVLDIGCGSYPIFLLAAKFVKKFGIDKTHCTRPSLLNRFELINYDIEKGDKFSFADNSIDVITMLAVLEHIEHSNVRNIMSEVYRILKPDGICIITTPSSWTVFILHLMGNLGLVSKEEIGDHKVILKNSEISRILKKSKFRDIEYGYFEFFMNRWFLARK